MRTLMLCVVLGALSACSSMGHSGENEMYGTIKGGVETSRQM